MDTNSAALNTLVQQSLDSDKPAQRSRWARCRRSVQEVQANTGARMDTMTTAIQGLSDNMQDVQARVGKLSQQLTDMQNLLQSIDAKVSGGSPVARLRRTIRSRAGYQRAAGRDAADFRRHALSKRLA